MLNLVSFISKSPFNKNSLGRILFKNYSMPTYNYSKGTVQTLTSDKNIHTENDVENDYSTWFKEISNGNPDIEKKLKVMHFEISVLRENTKRVPSKLSKTNWTELLNIGSYSKKVKYLKFLFSLEKKKENRILKKQKNKEKYLQAKPTESQSLEYGLSNNSIFFRLYDQTLNKMQDHRLMSALLYSQHIVFDCSYDNYMSEMNKRYCAGQILLSYVHNRIHAAPFHLKLCNFSSDHYMSQRLAKLFKASLSSLPVESTSKSYLELYPKEKLVYLTPHSQEVLQTYNHDDVYIIGAFVDKGNGEKVSLAKAKENKLRMAKLPLDYYLNWKRGIKSLPLNTVIKILLDMRLYNNWNIAFKNIPRKNFDFLQINKH